METALNNIRIELNENLYIKDPESSNLGMLILKQGVEMIRDIGFEQFTFRKLANQIDSTESSIYRYFENKHKFLLYITSMYWSFIEYRLVIATNSIEDELKKLIRAIEVITEIPDDKVFNLSIDEYALREIVISEFTKAYHNKAVDDENKKGFFKVYKRIVFRIVEMIENIDSTYEYPRSLASLVVDGSLHQCYLAMHFQNITDCKTERENGDFFKALVTNQLNLSTNGITQ